MAEAPTNASLTRVAENLGIPVENLEALGMDLFSQWLTGKRRFPTLSQQNQEWYRTILTAAGKGNPSREDLKQWFGMPHGTAQYLSGVFYDPDLDRAQEPAKSDIADNAVQAIREASDADGLGPNEATFYLNPKTAKTLEALLIDVMSQTPMACPTLTRGPGVVKVTFSANRGMEALCLALGDRAADVIREAASPRGGGR